MIQKPSQCIRMICMHEDHTDQWAIQKRSLLENTLQDQSILQYLTQICWVLVICLRWFFCSCSGIPRQIQSLLKIRRMIGVQPIDICTESNLESPLPKLRYQCLHIPPLFFPKYSLWALDLNSFYSIIYSDHHEYQMSTQKKS